MKEYTVKKVSSPLTLEDERWEKIEYVELSEKWENLFPWRKKNKADTQIVSALFLISAVA